MIYRACAKVACIPGVRSRNQTWPPRTISLQSLKPKKRVGNQILPLHRQDFTRQALDKFTTRQLPNTSKIFQTTPSASSSMINSQPRNPTFKLAFYVTSPQTLTRVPLDLKWEEINRSKKSRIIRQQSNFLIKTNDDNTTKSLELLKQRVIITSFKIEKNNTIITSSYITYNNTKRNITPSYSVILTLRTRCFLTTWKVLILIRFCKTIISRHRGTPTLMMRLIAGDNSTYERLVANRLVHFLGRIFRIIESKPPPPIPAPCSKCNAYDHRLEDCKKPLKCKRCQGHHPTSACTSLLKSNVQPAIRMMMLPRACVPNGPLLPLKVF